jgi:hypothetical protein
VLVTLAALGVAALSTWKGWTRALLLTLVAGYAAFGLVFTVHYATHDYYHLPLVPIAALWLGGCWGWLTTRMGRSVRPEVVGRLSLLASVVVGLVLLLGRPPLHPTGEQLEVHVERSSMIGALVEHSTRVGFLADDFGLALTYYGDLGGVLWRPEPGESPEHTFGRLFGGGKVDYVVVAEERLVESVDGLSRVLGQLPVLERGDDWIVYDLRAQDPSG